jgi:hypothetical protein
MQAHRAVPGLYALLALSAIAARPNAAHAQVIVGGYGSTAWSDNRDLARVSGFGASVRLLERPLAFNLDWSTGSLRRLERPCAGLIAPGTCFDQALDVRSSIIDASAGWVFVVYNARFVEATMAPELSLGGAHVRYLHATSSQPIEGTTLFLGAGAAFLVTARPFRRVPLGLTLGTRLRAISRTGGSSCLHCSDPFRGSIAEGRLQAGLSYSMHNPD